MLWALWGEILDIRLENGLLDLSGLGALTEVLGDFQLRENLALQNLGGVELLNRVVGSLDIFGNPNLVSMVGLSGLRTIEGALLIQNNRILEDLDGIAGLERIDSFVMIISNDGLNNIEGLDNLFILGAGVTINENDSLQRLDAFMRLETMRQITIRAKSLAFQSQRLRNVDRGDRDNLTIEGNSSLAHCEVVLFGESLQVGGALNTTGNDSPCLPLDPCASGSCVEDCQNPPDNFSCTP